jgi:hypothetical protein
MAEDPGSKVDEFFKQFVAFVDAFRKTVQEMHADREKAEKERKKQEAKEAEVLKKAEAQRRAMERGATGDSEPRLRAGGRIAALASSGLARGGSN